MRARKTKVRRRRSLDSSLRDVKQDDSNNEVAPSRGGEQIDDGLDGLVGALVGGFESAVWAMLRVPRASHHLSFLQGSERSICSHSI
jgi:hypothetical protein